MDDRSDHPQSSGTDGKPPPRPDATEVGQPAGSPGGRGGTTCYGGVQRVAPRTKPSEPAVPPET